MPKNDVAKINGYPVAEGRKFVSRVVGNGHRVFMSVIASLFTITLEGVNHTFSALNAAATFAAKKIGAIDGTPDIDPKTGKPNERQQGGTTFFAPLDSADNADLRSGGIWKPTMIEATKGIAWSDAGIVSGYPVAEKKAAEPKALPATRAECNKKIGRLTTTVESMERTIGRLRSHMATLPEDGEKKTENAPAVGVGAAVAPAGEPVAAGKGGKKGGKK